MNSTTSTSTPETEQQLSEYRRTQQRKFLETRFQTTSLDSNHLSPSICLPGISGEVLEICLRYMASSSSLVDPSSFFTPEICLEVLSASNFLCLSDLCSSAASCVIRSLNSMSKEVISSIPRSFIEIILERSSTSSWKEVIGIQQLSWLLDSSEGTNDDSFWKIASLKRFKILNTQEIQSGHWKEAFIQELIQCNLRSIELSKRNGEEINPKTVISLLNSLFQGLEHPIRINSLCITRGTILEVFSKCDLIAKCLPKLEISSIEDDKKLIISDSISHFVSLTSLCIRGTKLRKIGIQQVVNALISSGSCFNLKSLNFSDISLGVDSTEDLCKLLHHTNKLKWLDVSSNQLYDSGAILLSKEIEQSLPFLHTIGISDCKISDNGMISFAKAASAAPNLLSVYSNSNLENKEKLISSWTKCLTSRQKSKNPMILLDFSAQQPLTSARTAELASRGIENSEIIGEKLIHFSNSLTKITKNGISFSLLYKLCLDGIMMSQQAVNSLSFAAERGGISCISLSGCRLKDNEISKFTSISKLYSLNISGNQIDSLTTNSLSLNLASINCELTSLDMTTCGITDKNAIVIFNSCSQNQSLTNLSVSGNSISGRSEVSLAHMLKTNKTITNLNLSWCNFKFDKAFKSLSSSQSPPELQNFNPILNKLDISHNNCDGIQLANFLSVFPHFFSELFHLNICQSKFPSKTLCESIGKLISNHKSIKELSINLSSFTPFEPIIHSLTSTSITKLFVSSTFEIAQALILKSSSNDSLFKPLSELNIICSKQICEILSSKVDCLSPLTVNLIPFVDSTVDFPSWIVFPPLAFPSTTETEPWEAPPPQKRQHNK